MNRFGYIENKTELQIDFNPFILGSLEKATLSGQCDNSYSYFKISEQFYKGNLNIYDTDNVLLDESEFQKSWRFYHENIIQYSGNTFKVYEFLSDDAISKWGNDFRVTPKSVDYKKDINGRLHPKYTFLRGFLTECEYFENASQVVDPYTGFTGLTYDNSVLKVNFDYYIGSDGYVSHRTSTRSWCLHNEEYSVDTKVSMKYYEKNQAKKEGKVRRLNIVDQITLDTGGLIVLTESGVTTVKQAEELALPFLDEFDGEIDKYTKGNTSPLISGIVSASIIAYPWLMNEVPGSDPSTTIQEYVIYNLSGGTVENVGLVK